MTTLVLTTQDAVNTTSRTFPQSGKCSIPIHRNNNIGTVDIWTFGAAYSVKPLTIIGGKFVSYGLAAANVQPSSLTQVNATTVTLPQGVDLCLKIELDKGVDVAHVVMDYYNNVSTTWIGGTEKTEAIVDRRRLPYNITSLYYLFRDRTIAFDVTRWDVSKIANFTHTFSGNPLFNQDISKWNMAAATSTVYMLNGCRTFNQDLSGWTAMKLTNASNMFAGCWAFNSNISGWDMSNALSISGMFSECLAFNQDLSGWNVAKVTEMQYLFNLAPLVNFEVKNWAIQNVINMTNMFSGATSFNKDVSAWCAKFNVNVVLSNFLNNSGLSTTNYDNFLIALWLDVGTTRKTAWDARTATKVLGAAALKYTSAAASARSNLVAAGWTITDGGQI